MAAGAPWIGFAVKKNPGKEGLFVKDVTENGPAEKAGLKKEDEIFSIDGRRVTDPISFKSMFATWKVGNTIHLEVARDAFGVDNANRFTCTLIVGEKKRCCACSSVCTHSSKYLHFPIL